MVDVSGTPSICVDCQSFPRFRKDLCKLLIYSDLKNFPKKVGKYLWNFLSSILLQVEDMDSPSSEETLIR